MAWPVFRRTKINPPTKINSVGGWHIVLARGLATTCGRRARGGGEQAAHGLLPGGAYYAEALSKIRRISRAWHGGQATDAIYIHSERKQETLEFHETQKGKPHANTSISAICRLRGNHCDLTIRDGYLIGLHARKHAT